MEHLSIDDFIRVEEHLSKKLTEACGLYKFIVTKICENFNEQPLSRDKFERFYRGACKKVKDLFKSDCELLERFFPNYHTVIQNPSKNGLVKIGILHELEWQNLSVELP